MDEHSKIFISEKLNIHRCQFWQSAWIWTQRPHIVNRRLFGMKTMHCFVANNSIDTSEIISELSTWNYQDVISASFNKQCKSRLHFLHLDDCTENYMLKVSDKSFLTVRKLLNKNSNHNEAFEISFINYPSNEILYFPFVDKKLNCVDSPTVPFILKFIEDRIFLKIVQNETFKECNYSWLNFLLLPKLVKWANESPVSEKFIPSSITSLNCIDTDRYNDLYTRLKDKYGRTIVEKWTESTDPSKFVYEDIAIATYLCLLWKEEDVTFVDLGCGNGLLVHILNSEGYKGFGIDIRSRKIWSLYPSTTDLRVGIITPTDNSYFPDVDWIIGNHSDELTPWIPLFALRNSYKCKFFLLPCCAYEFSGRKYQRQNSSLSVYNDYLSYVKSICEDLGFEVRIDKLRIPSTKRTCIIGEHRNYECSIYDDFMNEKVESVMKLCNTSNESQFKPRERVERVRNCTQIDKSITSKIVNIIAKSLINNQLGVDTSNSESDIWSIDYSISFKDAISLLRTEDLKELKSECGGLQTLLRNHHSIFLIRGGRIYFRKPVERNEKCDKWKKRPCWFFHNHPSGCPLEENKCSFIHY